MTRRIVGLLLRLALLVCPCVLIGLLLPPDSFVASISLGAMWGLFWSFAIAPPTKKWSFRR